MNESQYEEINRKLELIIKLLSTQIVNGKDYREQVFLLDKIGLKPKEIADITGKTPNNVKVTLHLIKKSLKKTPRKTKNGRVNNNE